ncbi:glycosyltransferase family 4 protein [Candidatus Kaiserbacteria bacterium]|nr:glycosyltransferase family 4 protein [Candidatus Kaiserbacteria bacterium]
MRFLIATGIYPPEVGGPAYYAKNLGDALREKGHHVNLGTFGALKRLPSGLRHLALFFKLIPHARSADVVIALDTFSAALPALFASRLFRKPLIVRTGGDFLWEQYVERTGDLLPLPLFYEKHRAFTLKERCMFALTRYLLHRATIVFSSVFQRDIWARAYGLDAKKTHLIENAVSGGLCETHAPAEKNFLAFGRDIKLKNTSHLYEAFTLAQQKIPGIVLETGQVPHSELMDKISCGYAVILPSVSEVSPNYILDAIRCGKPFILTKYSEYARLYGDLGLLVDPLDVNDIAEKIVQMCDETTYAELSRRISTRLLTRTYADVAEDFQELVKNMGFVNP